MANKKVILYNPSDSTEEWYPTTTDDNVYSADGRTIKDKYITFETQSTTTQSLNLLLNTIYPVGSVRISFNDGETNFMGGTWVKVQDRFLLGAGSKTVGSTGGEETHTLTTNEMPSHSHVEAWSGYDGGVLYNYGLTYGSGSNWGMNISRISTPTAANTASPNYLTTWGTGGSQAHNNMPPYIVVFIYRRTA